MCNQEDMAAAILQRMWRLIGHVQGREQDWIFKLQSNGWGRGKEIKETNINTEKKSRMWNEVAKENIGPSTKLWVELEISAAHRTVMEEPRNNSKQPEYKRAWFLVFAPEKAFTSILTHHFVDLKITEKLLFEILTLWF